MARFRPNPRFRQEIERQAEHKLGLVRAAEPARERADQLARGDGAPWMPRSAARNVVVIDSSGSEVRIVNTDFAAHLQEFGSVNNPPHAPLRRGVTAAGLRLRET